jgi:RNA polymerase sigma-70 factor (ECF subfamily)
VKNLNKNESQDNQPDARKKPGTHIIGSQPSKSQAAEKLEDQQLWHKLKLGSELAFKQLFLKYNEIFVSYGQSISSDAIFVEDCIHDVFIDIWARRDRLSQVESVKYYLLVAFRRRLFRAITEQTKANKILEGIKKEHPRHEDFFQDRFYGQQSDLQKERSLLNAINELPERQKEALELRYFQDLTYSEMVSRMHISYVSARKLVSKAIGNLRKKKF